MGKSTVVVAPATEDISKLPIRYVS